MINKEIWNINMNGKEYLEYKKSKRLTKKQFHASIYFALSLIGLVFVVFLIAELSPEKQSTGSVFDIWYEYHSYDSSMTWNEIGKKAFLFFAPFIIVAMGIAWVLHGFGFIIIRR